MDEKQPSWIAAHVHMYEYFGGVAKILVPDNLLWSSVFVTLVAKKYRLATMLPFVPRMVCDSR